MSEELVTSASDEDALERILVEFRLVRTGRKGFPQDGRYYIGRDGLSVWRQHGPRSFTSTADLFEFLEDVKAH